MLIRISKSGILALQTKGCSVPQGLLVSPDQLSPRQLQALAWGSNKGFYSTVTKADTFSAQAVPVQSGVARSSNDPFLVPEVNKKRNSNRYQQATMILRHTIQALFPASSVLVHRMFADQFTFLDKLFSCNQKEFCDIVQLHMNWVKAYLLTGSVEQRGIPDRYWNQADSVPHVFGSLVRYLASNPDRHEYNHVARIIFSLFSLTKVIVVPTPPSLSTITAPFSGTDPMATDIDMAKMLGRLGIRLDEVGVLFKSHCENATFHESMSAGPNGHAMWSAHLDCYELNLDPVLSEHVRNLANSIGLYQVCERMDNIYDTFSLFDFMAFKHTGGCHSRLHVLYEKSTKARIIAIGDYFTQTVLSPFHNTLASILKNIPMDATFDQEAGFEKVRVLSSESNELHSLDLSAATDRLPVAAQARMIGALLSKPSLGTTWAAVMSDRDFMTNTGHSVRYSVGQPMGFKSSFPALALFHHVIVQHAAFLANFETFTDYVILGDDVVIANDRVALEYRNVMSSLGMEISVNKTLSPEIASTSGAEFAARLTKNGVELSPLPMRGIVSYLETGRGLVSLWDLVGLRGFFKGQMNWAFFSIFTPKRDEKFLIRLNCLPTEVTGLRFVLPPTGGNPFTDERLANAGFSRRDIINFYLFVVVTEALIKIDSAAKASVDMLRIVQTDHKVRPEESDVLTFGTHESLAMLVMSQSGRYADTNVLHPVQDVVRQIGTKLLKILNMFSGSALDVNALVTSPSMSAVNFSFEKKAAYSEDDSSVFGDRRVLAKAMRLLKQATEAGGKETISYTGSIAGITHLWVVKVTLGGDLLVTPHVSKLAVLSGGAESRLKSAVSEVVSESIFGEEV